MLMKVMVHYMHYQNPTFDTYYEKSFKVNDPIERRRLYQIMDSLVMTSYPFTPLYYDQVVRFTQKEVNGLSISPLNDLKLKKVWKTKKPPQ